MSIEIIPGTWTLDTSHSEVGFTVRHAGISKVRGAFTDVTGTLTVGDSIATSKVEAIVKTESFDSNDNNRDAHVKGADFFNVEEFPEMTFVSTGVAGSPEAVRAPGQPDHQGHHQAGVLQGRIRRRCS